MPQRLYLHMGSPKTGTTSIQVFCYVNRDELKKQDVYYPVGKIAKFHFGPGHNICCSAMSVPGCYEIDWQKIRNDFFEEMLVADMPVNIISAENLMYEHTDNLKFWNRNFEVFPIYFFTNYYDYILRLQKEFLKRWTVDSVFSIMKLRYFRILGTIKHQLKLWPRDRFTFGNYDRIRGIKGDIREKFMEITGIRKTEDFRDTGSFNVAWPDYGLGFLYQLTQVPIPFKERMQLSMQIGKVSLPKYDSYIFNGLPSALFSPDNYMRAAFRFQGVLLEDPDWFDWTMERCAAHSKARYMDLEPHAQHDIFEALPASARDLLRKYLPHAGRNRNQPFLPSMAGGYC